MHKRRRGGTDRSLRRNTIFNCRLVVVGTWIFSRFHNTIGCVRIGGPSSSFFYFYFAAFLLYLSSSPKSGSPILALHPHTHLLFPLNVSSLLLSCQHPCLFARLLMYHHYDLSYLYNRAILLLYALSHTIHSSPLLSSGQSQYYIHRLLERFRSDVPYSSS